MKTQMISIMNTLQYALEVFEETCQCGECDPCIQGQADIRQSIEDIQAIAQQLGVGNLIE